MSGCRCLIEHVDSICYEWGGEDPCENCGHSAACHEMEIKTEATSIGELLRECIARELGRIQERYRGYSQSHIAKILKEQSRRISP